MKSLTIGAILWDIVNDKEYIGGAQFNVASHLARLGYESSILSCIGNDERGVESIKEIERFGVSKQFIKTHPTRETGIANVIIDNNGSPSYSLPEAAYDFIPWNISLLEEIKDYSPDVICIGTHEQRSSNTVKIFNDISDIKGIKHIYYDVNLRNNFLPKDIITNTIAKATILKLNDLESQELSMLLFNTKLSIKEFIGKIAVEFSLKNIIITLGENGCLINYENKISHIKGNKVKVKSTIGCGDAFTAGYLSTLLRKGNPILAAQNGNLLGAYVAQFNEAVPVFSSEIKKIIM